MKKGFKAIQEIVGNVSNPWREAIEENLVSSKHGALLVSNPWREAIEVCKDGWKTNRNGVSNPWREAILFSPLGEYGFSREGFALCF